MLIGLAISENRGLTIDEDIHTEMTGAPIRDVVPGIPVFVG